MKQKIIADHRAVLGKTEYPLADAEMAAALVEQGVLLDFGAINLLETTQYYGVARGKTVEDVRTAADALTPAGAV